MGSLVHDLLETQRILLEQFDPAKLYPRALQKAITYDNQAAAIIGLRSIGKTTLLLQQAIEKGAMTGQALYVSADHLFFLNPSLFVRLFAITCFLKIYIDSMS